MFHRQVLLRQKHNDQSAWQEICVQIRFSRTNGCTAATNTRKWSSSEHLQSQHFVWLEHSESDVFIPAASIWYSDPNDSECLNGHFDSKYTFLTDNGDNITLYSITNRNSFHIIIVSTTILATLKLIGSIIHKITRFTTFSYLYYLHKLAEMVRFAIWLVQAAG